MEKGKHLKIEVEIKTAEPTPAQAAAWRELWAKLLSKSKGREQVQSEPEKGQK